MNWLTNKPDFEKELVENYKKRYSGFNLIWGTVGEDGLVDEVKYLKHDNDHEQKEDKTSPSDVKKLFPNRIYGFSNGGIINEDDKDWSKVSLGKTLFKLILENHINQLLSSSNETVYDNLENISKDLLSPVLLQNTSFENFKS